MAALQEYSLVRIWTAFALLLLLSACQQAGGVRPETTVNAGNGSAMHYFEPEFDSMFTELGNKLERACVGRAVDTESLQACIRDQFAQAFDDSGQGRGECDHHSGVAEFMTCVAIGNTFIDVRRRLSDTSPLPSGFWTGESSMSEAVVDSIARRGIDACDESDDSEQVALCVENWFEDRLDLPAELTARCEAGAMDDEKRHACLGEAIMLRYMQDHVMRVDAVST
jgi:hypothetical protein